MYKHREVGDWTLNFAFKTKNETTQFPEEYLKILIALKAISLN